MLWRILSSALWVAALAGAALPVKLSQVGRLERAWVSLGDGGVALLDLSYALTLPKGKATVDFRFGTGDIPKEAVVLLPGDGRTVVISKTLREDDPRGCSFVLEGPGGVVPLRVTLPLRRVNWEPQYRLILSPDEGRILLFACSIRVGNRSGLDIPEATLFLPEGSSVSLTPLKANEVRLFSVATGADIPMERVYLLDLQKGQKNPRLTLKFRSPLKRPLLPGTARIYIRTGLGERLLCSTRLPYTPPGGEVKLKCGPARDLVGKRYLVSFQKEEVWREGRFCWATTREAYKVEVENHKKEAVTVEVVERIPDVWRLVKSSAKPVEVDAHTLKFRLSIPAGGKAVLEYEVERTIIGPRRRPTPFGPFERAGQ